MQVVNIAVAEEGIQEGGKVLEERPPSVDDTVPAASLPADEETPTDTDSPHSAAEPSTPPTAEVSPVLAADTDREGSSEDDQTLEWGMGSLDMDLFDTLEADTALQEAAAVSAAATEAKAPELPAVETPIQSPPQIVASSSKTLEAVEKRPTDTSSPALQQLPVIPMKQRVPSKKISRVTAGVSRAQSVPTPPAPGWRAFLAPKPVFAVPTTVDEEVVQVL